LDRLLRTADRRRHVGRRDYAIMTCAVRLGLRAGEIAALQLQDLDWDHRTLCLAHTKNRRHVLLPLGPAVAQALVAYLLRGRPATAQPAVFLSVAPPHRPLSKHGISKVVKRALLRASLAAGRYGAHLLRRTFAMRLVAQGASLKTVADLLRHQKLHTTLRYVKATPALLAAAAQPWPEVLR
jgi:site-specific recombinase XerD